MLSVTHLGSPVTSVQDSVRVPSTHGRGGVVRFEPFELFQRSKKHLRTNCHWGPLQKRVCNSGIRVIYGRSHIYLTLGICLGCKIQVSDLALFVDVIDVHVYFWCHSLVLIFYHIA